MSFVSETTPGSGDRRAFHLGSVDIVRFVDDEVSVEPPFICASSFTLDPAVGYTGNCEFGCRRADQQQRNDNNNNLCANAAPTPPELVSPVSLFFARPDDGNAETVSASLSASSPRGKPVLIRVKCLPCTTALDGGGLAAPSELDDDKQTRWRRVSEHGTD